MKCAAASACYLELPTKNISIGRYIGCATNNQAELAAIELALNYALSINCLRVLLVTDSRYCEGLLTKINNDWEFAPRKNVDIVCRIRELIIQLSKFIIVRVKGHRKENIGNGYADKIAKECRRSETSTINECPR